jgi:hypothetical protein
MAWPAQFESPDDLEQAELEIRAAVLDCFLSQASDARFGFTEDVAHIRKRYPDKATKWLTFSTIIDPDVADPVAEAEKPLDQQQRLNRYFAIELNAFNRNRAQVNELWMTYNMIISFGVKDEYKSDPARNSSDELTALNLRFYAFLANNPDLGLGKGISHQHLRQQSRRFSLADAQGRAANIIDDSLTVILEVC